MNKFKKIIGGILLFAPVLVLAQPRGGGGSNDIQSIIDILLNLLGWIVPLLIGVAVLFFLIGVVKYIMAGGDEDKRTEGRNAMIYGIIGLFVMISVWGLVGILSNTFNLDNNIPTNVDLYNLVPKY